MSAEKLAKVGEIMNGFVKDKKIAGGIVLVARNGKLVFEETYGLRNLDGKQPVERDTSVERPTGERVQRHDGVVDGELAEALVGELTGELLGVGAERTGGAPDSSAAAASSPFVACCANIRPRARRLPRLLVRSSQHR